MKKVELKGIITPILTPMNVDESVNLDELRNQIDRLINNGVHGIFPLGTNGEGYIFTKRVGFYGGFGFNTLTKDFLNEIGDTSLSMRTEYLNSLKKVCDEKVDIFMGNHTSNVNLIEKREYMIKYNDKNPFLDSTAWNKYLNSKYNELLAFISNE